MFDTRYHLAVIFVIFLNLGLGCWLFYLQVLNCQEAQKKAERIWLRKIDLAPARGNIYSRNFQILATCRSSYSVWADPNALQAAGGKSLGFKP